MKQTSNKDMLNAIRNQASAEYKEKIPVVMNDMEARGLLESIKDYPSIKNEFITTLTDKVVKTEFFSRVYENPLKMLKKGSMPYGGSIEELFVRHADAKGFFKDYTPNNHNIYLKDHQQLGNHDADALLGYKKADVKSLYITKNFAYVFDVSISDAQLKAAFTSQNGLSELVNQLVGSLTSGAELKEYEDMKSLLFAAAAGIKLEQKDKTGILKNTITEIEASTNGLGTDGGFQPMATITVKESALAHGDNSYSHGLAIELRAIAQRLKFMSEKYNMAKVKTFTNIDDLVFLTTPERMAQMDVEVLAQAFNITHAEARLRTIVVDELPKKFAQTLNGTTGQAPSAWIKPKKSGSGNTSDDKNVDCLGILIDRNFLQVIDTVNESRQFENGRALMTNVFLHKQGMMANCYFANAIAFIGEYAKDRSK